MSRRCRAEAGTQPVEFRQTNSETKLIEWVHEAIDSGSGSGIIINPTARGLMPAFAGRNHPAMTSFTVSEIETGRRLFTADWQFAAAAGTVERLPPMKGVEIAFAGRSNVGKSSLINALTSRKALARTSNTPGRTQELIYFATDSPLRLVDMPGYGYAEAPKSVVKAWTDLIHAYLAGRTNLARVYVLIDARHGLKAADEAVLKTLDEAAVSYQIVLTKVDQVKRADLEKRIAAAAAALAKRPAAFPDILATSAREDSGMPELRAAIARLLKERY